LNSQQVLKNKYFSKKKIQNDQQYNITVTKNVKNKTLLNKNPRIHCKIIRESTQNSLVFHKDD